ncbi:hypothetical protein EJ06DRAFT_552478 [Trichodelitschia bisporula]|uniref:Uncharacterized protein n=1 Tax=Trichodelitschia bisporula TaxID=703511 RepID=A0A6G1I9N7_9PEZI|nr:hypothetical protein EJ06DRAFT_552478 [Trichodelitschia bisporula]
MENNHNINSASPPWNALWQQDGIESPPNEPASPTSVTSSAAAEASSSPVPEPDMFSDTMPSLTSGDSGVSISEAKLHELGAVGNVDVINREDPNVYDPEPSLEEDPSEDNKTGPRVSTPTAEGALQTRTGGETLQTDTGGEALHPGSDSALHSTEAANSPSSPDDMIVTHYCSFNCGWFQEVRITATTTPSDGTAVQNVLREHEMYHYDEMLMFLREEEVEFEDDWSS